jgi:hypothetical protein
MLLRGKLTIAAAVGLVCFGVAYAIPGQPETEISRHRLPHAPGSGRAEAAPGVRSLSDPALAAESDAAGDRRSGRGSRPLPAAPPAPPEVLGRVPLSAQISGSAALALAPEGFQSPRLVESLSLEAAGAAAAAGPLRVEYTLDAELTEIVQDIFRRGRVQLGLAVVLDPVSGEVLAYTGTDAERLPPQRAYPAASLVKVVTAAAALAEDPRADRRACRFNGSPYRLTPARLAPPRRGTEVTLERALATSNNQCFAQIAVRDLGPVGLVDAFERFGLLEPPAPGHEAGRAADPGDDRYLLGKMGCGLAGLSITALHAAQLAAVLADGSLPAARWITRVTDSRGVELALPPRSAQRRVLDPGVARRVREMMVATTVSGTARSAFRRDARPLLARVPVAAKTGSLSGRNPPGRYEWFIATAPADQPRVALAVLVVQGRRWHVSGSQVGARILRAIFCRQGRCAPELADRWLLRDAAPVAASLPILRP